MNGLGRPAADRVRGTWSWTVLFLSALLIQTAFSPVTLSARGTRALSLLYDLESDDGGFTHGGEGDPWEWGVPGPGTTANPGPGGAADGTKAWGSPLNGTYANGTEAYLEIPPIDTEGLTGLSLTYSCWYDLTYTVPDESSETGEGMLGDHVLLQARNGPTDWNTLRNHSGIRTSEWQTFETDLVALIGGIIEVRFLLVENGDGHVDNGFFLDSVVVSADEHVPFSISFDGTPSVPIHTCVGRTSKIMVGLDITGDDVPSGTYLSITVFREDGSIDSSEQLPIEDALTASYELEWTPQYAGNHIAWLNLTSDGSHIDGLSFQTTAHNATFYDSADLGISHWDTVSSSGDPEWTISTPAKYVNSSSRGKVFWSGKEEAGTGNGFKGLTYSYMESDWIDLSLYRDAYLYLYQRYEFGGEQGSCGGVVQALDGMNGWEVVEPDLPRYLPLEENISGPLEGYDAFQGSRDWHPMGFDLGSVAGYNTRLRFSVSSGEGGEGEGWSIDDIMVVGEGYDPGDDEPPTPIEGLEVEIVQDGEVLLQWYPSLAEDISSYRIYVQTADFSDVQGLVPYTSVDASYGPSAMVHDLDPYRSYWVAVTGVDLNGNENTDVVAIRFEPSNDAENRPPVAKASVVGPSTLEQGETFEFDGSGSYDPDGDSITVRWEMPDGTTSTGETAVWRPEMSGRGLIVSVEVEDDHGLKSRYNLTVNVVKGGDLTSDSDDLMSFLICLLPILLAVLFVIILIATIRGSRKRRLERRLIKMDLTARRIAEHRMMLHHQFEKHRNSKERTHVLDLVPVIVKEPARKAPMEWIGPAEAEKKGPAAAHEAQVEKEQTPAIKVCSPGKRIKAVIECPYCGETFRKEIDKADIGVGGAFYVECPHCGRSGNVNQC